MRKIDFVRVDRRSNPTEQSSLFCSICDFALRTHEDRMSYDDKKCCYRCSLAFADANLDRWKDGWRPSPEAVAEEVSRRLQIPVSIDLSILGDS